MLLIKSTNREPATATTNDMTLNPVTPTPKNLCPKYPPTIAPKIPKIIEPTIPPKELGEIKFAIVPANKPKIIQYKMLIVIYFKFNIYELSFSFDRTLTNLTRPKAITT